MNARKPIAVGSHVLVQLYNGRIFPGVVKAIHDTVAGRKFRVNHRDMTWKLDADQILHTVRQNGRERPFSTLSEGKPARRCAMTKAHRLKTRKPKLPVRNFPLNFLLGCGQNSLEDFELARLAEVADLRKELHVILDRTIDAMCQAALSSWFKSQDRQSLKHAIENEESPIEYAKRMIRDGQRSEEELLLPLPSLIPGAAHLAAATRYQKRNLAEGKCSLCPEPLDRNSVRFCTEHLRKSRERQRAKKGPRSEPGSAEYLYSGEVTPSTHGRQAGTLQSLALSREKQTRKALAEMGVPPESAATALHAVQSAILKFLPTSEAVAVKEDDLFAMIDVPSRGTARNALMGLLKAGKIGRVGQGVSGDPFRYFAAGNAKRTCLSPKRGIGYMDSHCQFARISAADIF